MLIITVPSYSHILKVSWVAGFLAVCSMEAAVQPDRGSPEAGRLRAVPQPSTPPATPQAAEAGGKPAWLRFLNMSSKRGVTAAVATQEQPQTIAEMADIVAANTPVFFFHNQEK
jgi:hypothetical protein